MVSRTDYYPFGMAMPNRNLEGSYRYGYQGQFAEKEPELGNGINSFELRLWDSRIGRWLSPDPYGQFASPYLGMGNNPIKFIDPDGGMCVDSAGNVIPCPDGYEQFNGPTPQVFEVWNDGTVFELTAPTTHISSTKSFSGTTLIAQTMIDFVRLQANQSNKFTYVELQIPDNKVLRDRDDVMKRSMRESTGFNRTFSNIKFDSDFNVIETGVASDDYVLYYTTGNIIRSSNWDSPYTGKPEPLAMTETSLSSHEGAIWFSSNPRTVTNGTVGAIVFKKMNDKHKFIEYFLNIRDNNCD